ncbi:hypothetical protein Hypma_005074 [Hypsizygus marmoreus]|uniref:F-box domain-containing protein n=1 Tax=Hypsizygus marmoreus TaxID=39966 RepID=A0A369JZ39_HYPMA|nr:hypothetical protein Hypma_005074 [Hypsizygus marmoreus]
MSTSGIPQEILDKIIDEIVDDPETLKRCALSFRSLLPRSQRRLFFVIRIEDLVFFRRLRAILTKKLILATYIRHLDFKKFPAWIANNSRLLLIFRVMTSLETLNIAAVTYSSWSTVSHYLRHAISDLPSRIRRGSSTTNMLMNMCAIKMPNQPGASFAQLRSFSIDGIHSFSSLSLIVMQASARTLEKIELRDIPQRMTNFQKEWLSFDFTTLPQLQCLRFTFTLFPEESPYVSASPSLLDLCDFIKVNPSVSCVEMLQLVYVIRPACYYTCQPNFAERLAGITWFWNQLDKTIYRTRPSAVTPFAVEVILEMGVGTSQELVSLGDAWREAIGRRMPRTAARGFVVPMRASK